MAVPKQKHTKSRRDKRRAHIFLTAPSLTKCKKCGKLIRHHTVCPYCGFYKGELIVENPRLKVKSKKGKKANEKEV